MRRPLRLCAKLDPMLSRARAVLVAIAMVFLLACPGCAPRWKYPPHDEVFQRAEEPRLHRMPSVPEEHSDWWDLVLHSTVLPLGKLMSPARYIDRLRGGRPALDVNAFGQVPDSTWFESRIGKRALSVQEMQRGSVTRPGPAAGPLTILRGQLGGLTPGVVLRDSAGVVWFVKFDPPGFPEMTTSAEIIASRILHAAGYFVPEMHLVDLDISRFVVAKDATTRDKHNRVVPFDKRALGVLLIHMNTSSKGRLRALFSRAVDGRPLGPFYFRGVRSDDPNDRIPHERRRSLRGLWVLYAWLNNTDARNANTLDTFLAVRPDGRGYVKHYLLDFGDSLGSAGNREKYIGEGYELRFDWFEMARRIVGVGLVYPYWLMMRRSPYRSVGPFESDFFDPERWEPLVPNPAFAEATAEDTFWGASLLARLTPELIAAAVEVGEYSESGAAPWVVRILLIRREKMLHHVFARMLPIDNPVVVNGYEVRFTDLEILAGLRVRPRRLGWRVRWNRTGGRDVALGSGTMDQPSLNLRELIRAVMAKDPSGFAGDPYVTLELSESGGGRVELHLRVVRDELVPVGLKRQPR